MATPLGAIARGGKTTDLACEFRVLWQAWLVNFPYKAVFYCAVILLLGTFATWSQTVISSGYDQVFRSIGIDTNGKVTILGGSGGGTVIVYELTETGFQIIQLPPLAYDGFAEDARMSRDGQCVVTDDILGDIVIPALWVRTQADRWLHPNQVAATFDQAGGTRRNSWSRQRRLRSLHPVSCPLPPCTGHQHAFGS